MAVLTSWIDLALLQHLFRECPVRDFAVGFWDGTLWSPDPSRPPRFTVVVRNPDALALLFEKRDEAALGQAFVDGHLDVTGNLEAVFPVAEYLLKHAAVSPGMLSRAIHAVARGSRSGRDTSSLPGRKHTKERDAEAARRHYDLSNEFYGIWLDPQMVYSCAYFEHPDETLEVAQARKIDYICRKLRLRRGDRFLDIGCGWGGLMLHAVERYGVEATGNTVSARQAQFCEKRIDAACVSDRAQVLLADYRDIEGSGQYDKLASIGMFEHVGEALQSEYFARAWRLLRPGGAFLNHAIARRVDNRTTVGRSFIDEYVFPDGELLTLDETLGAAEAAGFEVRDVENLREHYVLTLRLWMRRLEARADNAVRLVGEKRYRTWRLYLAGSAQAFDSGRLSVFQTLLVKPDQGRNGLPLTREDWYRSDGAEPGAP